MTASVAEASPCPRALDPRDAESLAEIERLKRTNLDLAALLREQGYQMLAIRERITGLEAELAASKQGSSE